MNPMPAPLSRRQLTRAAAWATPVVALAGAAPQAAASEPAPGSLAFVDIDPDAVVLQESGPALLATLPTGSTAGPPAGTTITVKPAGQGQRAPQFYNAYGAVVNTSTTGTTLTITVLADAPDPSQISVQFVDPGDYIWQATAPGLSSPTPFTTTVTSDPATRVEIYGWDTGTTPTVGDEYNYGYWAYDSSGSGYPVGLPGGTTFVITPDTPSQEAAQIVQVYPTFGYTVSTDGNVATVRYVTWVDPRYQPSTTVVFPSRGKYTMTLTAPGLPPAVYVAQAQ